MAYLNPMECNGYIVIAVGSLAQDGQWEGTFVAKRENEPTIEQTTSGTFSSKEEAEQRALSLARLVLG